MATTLGIGVLMVIAAPATVARAQTAACAITIADSSPPAGSIQMVVGDHFPTTPRSVPIVVSDGGQVGLASIDDNGHFADPVRLPADLPEGTRTISVECGSSVVVATSRIQVVRGGATDTRSDDDDDDVDGGALVVSGVLAVVAALALTVRRRRTERVTAA